ncbi:MAG: MFS transporter [Rhodobacterales bacterium]|nr:MFS transporter [Rhodobacterales bacterium]
MSRTPTPTPTRGAGWRRPEVLLMVMAAAMPLAFSTWQALLNNFAIERAAFTGVEIGILQSLREIPGFLSFTMVLVLLVMREQTLALTALLLLGVGTAITGLFPFELGLYCTTVIMSMGFHFYEAVGQSLALQWVDKDRAPHVLGRLIAAGSLASLVAYGGIWLAVDLAGLDMPAVYMAGGGLTVGVTLVAWMMFPTFPQAVEQRRSLVLRGRYWLYYALTFMKGARRQIFVVFAGFLMVEKFGFDVATMTLMMLANHVVSMMFAPWIGRMIGRWGERRALIVEYAGLTIVFAAYAFVEVAGIAVALYVVDHLFFAMAIAIKTYFQKIGDPADMASTAGVSFTINHIAAVVIPALFGLIWIASPSAVFLIGAAFAVASLGLALMVPRHPGPGEETTLAAPLPAAAAE